MSLGHSYIFTVLLQARGHYSTGWGEIGCFLCQHQTEVVNTETLVIGICALLPLIQPQASGVQQKSTP